MGTGHDDQILTLPRSRIGKDRPLILQCCETVVCFKHAQQAGLVETCLLLKPHFGVYHMKAMALTVRIVPAHTRITKGAIIQTIE